MDSNKKQPKSHHHARATKSSLASAELNRKSNDLHANNNNKSRNSRRREQLPTPRNEQQQHQQQPAKLRTNVDKRPQARGSSNYYQGYGLGGGAASAGDHGADGGSGLADAGGVNYRRSDFEYELNSVYLHGSKKQNLNHLLNFVCVPRDSDYATGPGIRAGAGVYHAHRKPRYNKEQFLQANFQFVIRGGAKLQVNGSPDTLIDWSYIEQINIQTTEEPQCPICLYPPVAAKLTRCGHAYCWPCLLHYLSLSDKTWRKCPICYDAIHAADVKSCTIEQQRALNVADCITFQLMRRRKGSMFIERYSGDGQLEPHERFPLLGAADEAKRYSKFLIAKRGDVAGIIDRERRELLAESDVNCPEHVFVQQALLALNERRDKLGLSECDELDEEEEEPPVAAAETAAEVAEKEDAASVSSGSSFNGAAGLANGNNKYYYFYQSNDGQNIYLHPLNVKMLQACYGTLEYAPVLIEAHIVQREQHSMDEEHRRKFTCLGHMPLTCQFAVVEVELQPPTVSSGILRLFRDDLLHRKKERQRREREERKREQHINELNDRQMGKLIASAANLNLSSAHEFPTCGFEEALPTPSVGPQPVAQQVGGGARPKVELWPTIGGGGSSASGSRQTPIELKAGAWGRAAPPPVPAAAAPAAADPDNELRAVGPWALGDLLLGALDQQKTQKAAKESGSKKQKKSKKMVPLFAVGMNRAP